MKCIAIINQKGGTGKTTTSTNLAYCLALRGKKTILIDLDPQGHSSMMFCNEEPEITAKDLFLNKQTNMNKALCEAYIEKVRIDNLYIVPSNIKLALVAEQIGSRVHKEKILANHLKNIDDSFDFVILDCPPNLGVLSINGIYAATKIFIPVTYCRYALEGMADLFEVIREVKESFYFDYTIIRNIFDIRNKQTNNFIDAELEKFKNNLAETIIRKTESINQSRINCEPILFFDKKSHGAEDFTKLTEEVLV